MSAIENELSISRVAGNFYQWVVLSDGSLGRQPVRLPIDIIDAVPNNIPAPPDGWFYWSDAEFQINLWLFLLSLYQWEMFPDAELKSKVITETDGMIVERFGYPESGMA